MRASCSRRSGAPHSSAVTPSAFRPKSSTRHPALARVPQRLLEMDGGSLADLAAMMGLSSVNITDSMNKDRERRSSNTSDSSDASSVAVSLSLAGGEVQVTLDTSAFGEAEVEASPAV